MHQHNIITSQMLGTCLYNRRRVEESDHALTEDLFGGGGGGKGEGAAEALQVGVEGIPLKTTQDHVTLAIDLGEKLSKDGKSSNILALVKELITRVEGKLSLEETNQVWTNTVLSLRLRGMQCSVSRDFVHAAR